MSSAIGIGSGDIVARLMEEEKKKTDAYAIILKEKMIAANVSIIILQKMVAENVSIIIL